MMHVPTSIVDWADIYAEHGQSMRTAARAAIGVNRNASVQEILGKSADDVVGDVIEELMTKGTDLGQIHNLHGYLNAAVRNRVRDLHRRSKFESPDDLDPDIIVGDRDIEAEIDREELRQQAKAALSELPGRERYALVERIMKRRPAQDVAAELGVKPQQVSQLYNAALKRLRRLPEFADLLSDDVSPRTPSTPTEPDARGTSP